MVLLIFSPVYRSEVLIRFCSWDKILAEWLQTAVQTPPKYSTAKILHYTVRIRSIVTVIIEADQVSVREHFVVKMLSITAGEVMTEHC